jgi:gliding motility-associated lipoprotein GldH
MKGTLLIFSILLTLLSCDNGASYEEFISLPDTWNAGNILHFNVNITDTAEAQNVYISVRNTGKYQFSNLYLFVTAHSPNGVTLRDTVEIVLADDRGKWLGKGAASVFTFYYPYKSNIRFPMRGIYSFDVEQAMWIKDLKNISDIGLRIEKAGGKP